MGDMSMSTKIVRFGYKLLRREEQHSFHDRVLQILLGTCGKCGAAYERFELAAKQFDILLTNKALAPSLSLKQLDATADAAWSSLNAQVQASLMHPRAEVRDAAERVNAIFSKTPNPTNLNYDQEYGALKTLLSQIATIDAETLKTAWVDEHVAALQMAVEDFVTASANKVDALSKKQSGEIKAAETACYKAWQDLAKYLEVMENLGGLAGSADAIDQLNAMNTAIKRRLDIRKANKNGGNEAEDNVNIVEFEDSSKVDESH